MYGLVVDQKKRVFVFRYADRSIALLDGSGGSRAIAKGHYFAHLCNDPGTNALYASEPEEGRLYRIDPDTGAVEVVASGLQGALGIAFAEGWVFVATRGEGKIFAIEAKTGRKEEVVALAPGGGANTRALVFDEGGKYLYAATETQNRVYRIDLKERKVVREWPAPHPSGLFVESASTLIFSEFQANRLSRLDLEGGRGTPVADGIDGPIQIEASDRPYPRYKSLFEPRKREWRYDFSSAGQMADWQSVGNPTAQWRIAGGTMEQANATPNGAILTYYLLKHVPSGSPRRFTIEASLRQNSDYNGTGLGHCGLFWSFGGRNQFTWFYIRSGQYQDVTVVAHRGGEATGSKVQGFSNRIGQFYKARIEFDLGKGQARVSVDGRDFGTFGVPAILPEAGSLGLWALDRVSVKDVYIRVDD